MSDEPHRLIAEAIHHRPPAAHLRSVVSCKAGAIVIRPTDDLNWSGLMEAVVLPLLAHQDFVISMEAYLAPSAEIKPSENPEASESVIYYLFEAGEMTEMWVTPIRRGDRGEITFGSPWEMGSPVMTSSGAAQLIQMIRLYAQETHKTPRDFRLEHELALVLSGLGHTIAWEQRPTS